MSNVIKKLFAGAILSIGFLASGVVAVNAATTPDVTATGAGSVSQTSATLNASIEPGGSSAEYWMEFGTTTSFERTTNRYSVPGTTGTYSVSQSVSNLNAGTLYYYRVKAQSSAGTGVSNVKTFTTAAAVAPQNSDIPDAIASSASVTGQNSAVLYGTVDANNLSTTYRFEYGAGNFGSSVNGGTVTGDSATSVSSSISGLSAGTTYQFRIVATNSKGNSVSNVRTFTTNSSNGGSVTGSPDVTATGATSIGNYAAYLNGIVNPNGLSTDVWFEYGTNNAFQFSTAGSKISVGSANGGVPVGRNISGLSQNTTYQYRVVGQNSRGTENGNILSFTTTYNNGGNGGNNNNNNNGSSGWTPGVVTGSITGITQTSIDIHGRVNPNGAYTEYWFEYGIGNAFDRQTSRWHLNPMSGETNVSLMIGNLNPNTSYNVRLVASNGYGTNNGTVLSFTTLSNGGTYTTSQLPVAVTFSATDISQNVAIFHAKANPMGAATSVWFEYGTSAGNLTKRTFAQNMGGEYINRNFAGVVTGLASGTTYYFRVGAANNNGTTYGEVLNFRTANYSTGYIRPTTPTIIIERTEEVVGIAGAEVMLDPSVSRLEPAAGDELDYTLTYRNASKDKLTNAVIKVSLPLEVKFVDSNVKAASVSGNNLTFNIGEVAKNSQGIITIKVKINDEVMGGSSIMFNSFMEYTDASRKFQTIDSYIGVTIKGNADESVSNGGFLGSFSGIAKALSGSWLLIILLILIFVALAYLIVTRRRDPKNS